MENIDVIDAYLGTLHDDCIEFVDAYKLIDIMISENAEVNLGISKSTISFSNEDIDIVFDSEDAQEIKAVIIQKVKKYLMQTAETIRDMSQAIVAQKD